MTTAIALFAAVRKRNQYTRLSESASSVTRLAESSALVRESGIGECVAAQSSRIITTYRDSQIERRLEYRLSAMDLSERSGLTARWLDIGTVGRLGETRGGTPGET